MKSDQDYMRLCITLGETARLIAPPNPWVGCLIVKNNEIIGKGHTEKPGHHHAEINALFNAGTKAENATLYVTLEPCSHYGLTPPCINAIISAKISRVVIALKDPDLRVSGNGIKALADAGISLTLGVLEKEAFQSLEPYLYQRTTGKPFVVAKSAISVDGRTAAADGSSKWISNQVARKDAHKLRLESQAILIGSGTALKDNPTLNVRLNEQDSPKQPLRVLFDATGKVFEEGPLFDQSIAKTLIFTSINCNPKTLKKWKDCKIEVEIIEADTNGRLNIEQALQILAKKGVLQLLVEGGSTLLASFLKAQAINRLVLYLSPKILGDKGIPLFQNYHINTMENAPQLTLLQLKQLDDCIRLDYKVAPCHASF
jgi:diaminohydroxyphosphoribosylaminopyrimidine deaminase/5-amino-6-(5-phosphoribosylamino)uracil reductase